MQKLISDIRRMKGKTSTEEKQRVSKWRKRFLNNNFKTEILPNHLNYLTNITVCQSSQ